MITKTRLILAALLLCATQVFAQGDALPPQTLFTNVNIFNGTESKLYENQSILVEYNLTRAISADEIQLNAAISKTSQSCSEPRPEICTQDYRPVCANLKDGTEKNYSNGCTACSDVNVDSWIDGECPK